ncbi:MAG: Asp-tRNA(Asn)/Glu-tRNA(Gln) amidotransferase subunit GatB [Caldilineaceae bacterium]|nr:Asp-tRNA(Asn)/Glu-tRNA(Gln) amidotransferase subunit GatB [Caldilineaceae bacterium]MBP8109787.1 Asp-tRNA(Asn)/Glu-tRNA(Gln) amidotransferase subunit GatB [Caldilineaceae bacterium]MBP8124728.1 Asp-tRNA(Asn)/Glu-tRNA(Gln) amidotransferase subunit GatB [Caldilineaceae bacterium]MBP9074581.1 Asp-tRNA(Asn)/Glu-tRNA(Gln) amidotransferase subunit GatB [Caldilineaceae bacterium]
MTVIYETVVGMEVHAQLLTRSKMFCSCPTDYAGAPPNTRVCPVCLGLPGAMPVINRAAVEATIKTGLALNCEIPDLAVFARKNYNYPDLPKGYQITQFELPQAINGWVEIDLADGGTKRIGIRRAHLEEDTGKNTHVGDATLVDLNRAGMPLMEIVTEADIASPDEAYAFLTKLRTILRYLGVNSGDMEKGAMRCEPNISIRTAEQAAAGEYGTKVEVKNLNSFRAVRSAIAYETTRQAKVLATGGTVKQVNMGWDESAQRTVLQRSKESSEDYRYFPEPDLPPVHVSREWVAQIRATLPELPDVKLARYVDQWGLRRAEAEILTDEQLVADFYEAAVTAYLGTDPAPGEKPQRLANWITGELFRLIYADGEGQDLRQIAHVQVQPAQLAALLKLMDDKVINATTGKKVLETMYASGDDPQVIVQREGLGMVSDTGAIDVIIQAVLDANADAVARFRGGEEKLFGFFMGQAMRAAKGKADPDAVKARLGEMLIG